MRTGMPMTAIQVKYIHISFMKLTHNRKTSQNKQKSIHSKHNGYMQFTEGMHNTCTSPGSLEKSMEYTQAYQL